LPEKKQFDLAKELFDWAQVPVYAFVSIVLLFTFVASVFSVTMTSMTDTLQEGDRLIISRLPYRPKRGDIILFTPYGYSFNQNTGQFNPMVKRIVGLPGDELEYIQETGTILRNGEALDEPYIREPMRKWGSMPERLTVPEGYVFVMGDNRNNSSDSRSEGIGFVDRRSILGRVILRMTPLDQLFRQPA
jgi:signal peptidase I